MSEIIKNRYDFTILFEVENGNPNGDPDAGNMPRLDSESGCGIVTDVCLKRKIRNYIEAIKENSEGYKIYIRKNNILNESDEEALNYVGISKEKLKSKDVGVELKIRDFMCKNFYDIRTFGAVMTTFTKMGLNCGQVTGPVQIGFAKSIDQIVPQEVTITRVAITKADDAANKTNEMGKKYIVPYALYRVDGYISANLAKKVTKFNEDDLSLLWESIINMFEIDRSAARGNMNVRNLFVFKHDSELGNAPAYKLFDTIHINKKKDVIAPRSYSDYEITINREEIPSEIEFINMI